MTGEPGPAVDHAQLFDHPFPWRTAAIAAAALALAELLALLVVAGVRLAPGVHHGAAHHPAARRALAGGGSRTHAVKPQPLRPRSHVSVLVLNGNGVTGAAGTEAARLLRKGYRAATPANAANHDYARSIVLYAPGYSREGRRLAHDTGVRVVGPLDGLRRSQLKGSQVVVILGGS